MSARHIMPVLFVAFFPMVKKLRLRVNAMAKSALKETEIMAYDPLFIIGGKTFGRYTAEEKDKISHRGNALRALKNELEKVI